MDTLRRNWYHLRCRLALTDLEGIAFEDFFSAIMEYAYPRDFQRIRPYGNQGDQKADGYLRSTQVVFQVYAPRTMDQARLIAKIQADFTGALEHWGDRIRSWIFVHNDKDGLPPTAFKVIEDLQPKADPVQIEVWGPSYIEGLVLGLSPESLEYLFGPVPTADEIRPDLKRDLESWGRIIAICPHPIDQHDVPELVTKLEHGVPDLKVVVAPDGGEPGARLTSFDQLIKRTRELVVLSGNVAPEWVQERIERASKIAALQPDEERVLETIWVARLRNGSNSNLRQPHSPPSPLIPVRVLDDIDIPGIADALVEPAVRPGGREEWTQDQSLAPNLFVGLRPFERKDSRYYFGRDDQVRALLTSLHRTRFLAVVGSSGCGKSSLIRAGLIPALEAGFLVQDRQHWRTITFKPGQAPLGHLAEALLAATGRDQGVGVATHLTDYLLDEGAAVDLERTLKDTLASYHSNLLLLVDQFEELFRFYQFPAGTETATHRTQAEVFVARLLHLATREGLPVYCVITMRSDFIGDCDRFTGLPEAINRGHFLVPRLNRVQRRETIVGPVRLTGERIATHLVNQLLNEQLDTRDDLPILQHVLMRCWDTWSEQSAEQPAGSGDKPDHRGPIDSEHYERVHTIHGALNRHADEALQDLDGEDRNLARRLFQALTEVDSSNRHIRRPTRLGKLCAITGATKPRLRDVIDCFRQRGERSGRNFLVLSKDQDPMVDISHESLIRQWHSLRSWVDEEAANADIYRRLAETAGKHSDAEPRFYRDAELQEAIAWQRRQQPTAAWAERYRSDFQSALAFLRESRLTRIEEHRERRRVRIERERERVERERLLREMAEQEQEKAEQDRRARRTARSWSLGLGVLAVLMLILAGYALHLRNDAREKTRIAESAEQEADAQFLKASINLARAHEGKSLALLERASNTERTGDYRRALLQALQAQRQPIRGQAGLQPQGMDRLTDPRIAGAFHERWRSPTPQLGSTPNDIAWSPNGEQLATAQSDGSIRLWAAATGRPLHRLTGHEESVTAVAFGPDGKLLASASSDRTVRLWDPATGAPVRTLTGHEGRVYSVALSADGSRLASASKDKTVRLWDPATGELIRTLTGHKDWVRSVAFSADGRRLASASDDRTVRLWGDPRIPILFLNGPAPSPRATLLSEALQRLWRLRLDGLDIEPEDWNWLRARKGYYVDQEFEIDVRPAAATADPAYLQYPSPAGPAAGGTGQAGPIPGLAQEAGAAAATLKPILFRDDKLRAWYFRYFPAETRRNPLCASASPREKIQISP